MVKIYKRDTPWAILLSVHQVIYLLYILMSHSVTISLSASGGVEPMTDYNFSDFANVELIS